ncbi:uncharacterized protein [Henckelia pumila]|uniref:uncharacterized protein n=1 Tax=Henckelia pumila TaxID=405737 RepID=UPI003C6E4CFD
MPKSIITMMRNQGVQVSYFKARRGKELALNTMMGDSVENFRKLPSFLKMVEKVNVGSFTDLEVDEEKRFKYMFLAYGACITGYKFMRKVVCIDGTFLKGKYDGVLLVATAQDGNHHQFPIAWGVVDKESSESWSCFLSRLKIIVEDDDELVIISDRHQGIINVVASLYNRAHHVFCMWHMSQNIKGKSNKKNGAAELFIRVAKAYKESDFDSLYTELRERFPEVAKYLKDNTSPKRWSRAKQTGNRYSIMTTNGVESINGRLREERELPITALLEALQRITSTWRSKYRQEAVASTTHLTPAIESIVRENFIVSRKYEVIEATEGKYCMYGSTSNELVDLQSKSCTCRKFDIDRIPCSHAIATAYNANISVYEFCTDYYTTRYWLEAYTDPVYPVPGEWIVQEEILLLPPLVIPRRGRKKVKRIPSVGE